MAQLTEFGKSVKKRLIDIDRSQSWLNERVSMETGMFCDSSRMAKILSGVQKSPPIETAIRTILNLADKEESQ